MFFDKRNFSGRRCYCRTLTAVSSLVPLAAQKNTPRVDIWGIGNTSPFHGHSWRRGSNRAAGPWWSCPDWPFCTKRLYSTSGGAANFFRRKNKALWVDIIIYAFSFLIYLWALFRQISHTHRWGVLRRKLVSVESRPSRNALLFWTAVKIISMLRRNLWVQ